MAYFQLAIHAADHDVYDGPCYYLSIPTVEGLYSVMANHVNTIFALTPGPLYYQTEEGGRKYLAAISTGFLKFEDNQALLIVNSLESPWEIDLQRALQAEERARLGLKNSQSRQERARLEASLKRALNRIDIKKRYHP